MAAGPSDGGNLGQQWDRVFALLAVEPRREIIRSLLDEPRERRLPLPEAAESPNQSMGAESLTVQLRHHHLPKLADAGYIRWERDPFCVQRGPDFEKPAFFIEAVLDSKDEIPSSLVDNCKIIQQMTDSGTD